MMSDFVETPGERLRTTLVVCAAVLSGASALAYEISWSRALVVPLGNSTDASALVLAGFMLGIAGGAHLGGVWSKRSSQPLRVYALLELVLGLYALAATALLAMLSHLPSALTGPAPGAHWSVARGGIALVLIALPCVPMGASLPLLVRALTTGRGLLRTRIGLVYGANTAGAAAGAFLTGFWGIASFGVWRWSSFAAAGSVVAALLAAAASLRFPKPEPLVEPHGPLPEPRASTPARLALLGAFVSGFAMLACEMLWARVLTFVFGHDTYAFASLLAIVLVGLAVGGLLHRLAARFDQRALLAALLALFSWSLLGSFWLAAELVVRFGRDPFRWDASGTLATSAWLELYRELSYAPVLFLLPAILAGAAFPASCALYGAGANDPGRKVAIVAWVNGVGAAAGAIAAAFGLVSAVGIQGGFVLMALVAAAASSAIVALGSNAPRPRRAVATLAPVTAVVLLAVAMPSALPRNMLLQSVGPRHQALLHYEEARTGTVSVIRNDINQERQLLMNAVNEVTTRLVHDQSFKILGHLGPLLHPAPKTGVMICLGAGLSAGATLVHPLERLDVIDLSSAVPRAARFFPDENNHVLDDSRFRFHAGDGRQFLLNSVEHYDLAIVDSTHPKSVDSWILYTREFYELVRDRLAEGGIAVQWLPLHGLSEREFKIVVRTFLHAFPTMTLWANAGFETYGQVAYAKLVGTKGAALSIDYGRLATRLSEPRLRADLEPYGMESPEEVLDLFLARADAVREWTEGLPVQTDDRPFVPYTTRYSAGRPMEPSLLLAVRSPATPLLVNLGPNEPEVRRVLASTYHAQGLVLAGLLDRAKAASPASRKIELFVQQTRTTLPYYQALAERYADDADRLFEAGTQLGGLGHPLEAKPIYERALALRPGDLRVRLDLALVLLGLGDDQEAIALLSRLKQEMPGAAIVHHNLGVALMSAGDPSAAIAHLEEAIAWDPEELGPRVSLARALLEVGELDRAARSLSEVVEANPWVAEAHDLLGLVAAREGDWNLAVERHRRAVSLHPFRAGAQYNLGVALQHQGRIDDAQTAYLAALELEPSHANALNNLGLIHAARAQPDRAADYYLEALDANPAFAGAAYNLGLALRSQGKPSEAAASFCLALRLDPALRSADKQLRDLDVTCDGDPPPRNAP